jgi:Flp pilus assembly protein TadD
VDAGAWGNLAMCLIQCGERAEARKAIDFAIDLDPQDPLNRCIRDNFESYFKK